MVAAFGAGAAWLLWQNYMGKLWTRDGTVRANIVTLAPDVAGQVVQLAVKDNQFVHKGDLLIKIDPRDCRVAVDVSKAALNQAEADYQNKRVEAERRAALTNLATTREEQQTYASTTAMAAAAVEEQKANLERANVNLARTDLRSPVNGWVTNLLLRQGDYTTIGQTTLSLVDADFFRVDGYFEETALKSIRYGAPAKIWLLGYQEMLKGMSTVWRAAPSSPTSYREERACRRQPYLHLGAARAAHTRARAHRRDAAGCPPRDRPHGDRRNRAETITKSTRISVPARRTVSTGSPLYFVLVPQSKYNFFVRVTNGV